MMKKQTTARSLRLAASCMAVMAAPLSADDRQPNIVLIMCDDMGLSDIGCYGGEVQTPHLDSLADAGLRFSQFKNTGRSCPSRASLLTGCYPHDAGMGWMTAVDEHRPGYRGQIDRQIPTLAELLREAGYGTYMSGKWHVTVDGAFGAPNGTYPTQRGFDRYYGSLTGGGSYFRPKFVYSNLTPVDSFPEGYYYTEALTDSAVSFIKGHPSGRPLFLYLAYFAPHRPLQAPADRVARCRSRYAAGYDVLRRERFRRMKDLGLVPDSMELPRFDREFGGHKPAWNELTDAQRREWTEAMATYAAMIEVMDDGVGRVADALRARGMADNTVFIFLSDNGATLEGGRTNQLMADLSNTPYRSYKMWCYEGGVSTPCIIADGRPQGRQRAGAICRQPAHITDILPTCLELSGHSYPGNGRGIALPGVSLWPAMEGRPFAQHDLYFEHQTSSALISGRWKIVRPDDKSPWELYDLSTDPYETTDVGGENPDVLGRLASQWQAWAERHNVLPLFNLSWGERIDYWKQRNPDQDGCD